MNFYIHIFLFVYSCNIYYVLCTGNNCVIKEKNYLTCWTASCSTLIVCACVRVCVRVCVCVCVRAVSSILLGA